MASVRLPGRRPPTAAQRALDDPYLLQIERHGDAARFRVRRADGVLLEWAGELGRRLLDSQPLPGRHLTPGEHRVGKKDVQVIALRAAVLKMRLDNDAGVSPIDSRMLASQRLWKRLGELGARLPAFHSRLALEFFRYPNTHFSEPEAVCMLSLEYPAIDAARLRKAAVDLARWGVIQRIDVGELTFYDIDTTPHLHVYSEDTRQLDDAPARGVVRTQ